jgi:hypothetical protein
MKAQVLFILFVALLLPLPLKAQQDSAQSIEVGTLVEGRIDDNNPRAVYSINGTRGAVLTLRLSPTSGNLDPVMSMFDPKGGLLFRRDDHAGSLGIQTTITFQENGVYLLVVGRFGYSLGTSSGDYELAIERVGVSSQEGSNLLYGVPIMGRISNTQPQVFFTFEANEGDILTITMIRSSGSLDPFLQIVDSGRFLLAENDDANSSTHNAQIDGLLIETTGTYIVVASRYGQAAGESVGSFVLTVGESANSGLGNSSQAPVPIIFNQTIEDSLTDTRYERYYSFVGQRDQLVTITMERSAFAGQLDSYLILANASFEPLIENDDSSGGSNSRIVLYRLPADGLYHIIATRFGGVEGTSSGTYRLTLSDEGFAFEGVNEGIPRLLYGSTVDDEISDADPDSIFAFWGEEGDRVIIAMDRTSGDLDSVLELLDEDEFRMLRDDDGGGVDQNARIETTLSYTGLHFIRAMRFDGSTGNANTAGTFRLTLTRGAE